MKSNDVKNLKKELNVSSSSQIEILKSFKILSVVDQLWDQFVKMSLRNPPSI